MHISYDRFKAIFGDLGITEWVKYNWLSNAGRARTIANKVKEAGYNPEAYVNDDLYNHITKSINIWDEEWEVRYTNFVFNKNYIKTNPNSVYFLYSGTVNTFSVYFRDKDGVLIDEAITVAKNTTFTTPSNCYFISFSYQGTTYNNDICINESNLYINGNYFPYFEGEKFLVLVGEVDLGTLTWTYDSNYPNFYSNEFKTAKIHGDLRCIKYRGVKVEYAFMEDKDISITSANGPRVRIKDSSYTDATTFKQAMSGVMLYYQLDTPVLVDL